VDHGFDDGVVCDVRVQGKDMGYLAVLGARQDSLCARREALMASNERCFSRTKRVVARKMLL
jgi:hypothetical protein